MSLFLLPGSEHGVGREFFICEDAAFVTPVCPRLVFGNAVPAHFVKYCIQPLRDRTFTGSPRRWEGTAFVFGKYQISDVKFLRNNSYLNCGWRWKWRMIIAINLQCKQSFLSNFCGLENPRPIRYISSSRQRFVDPPELLLKTSAKPLSAKDVYSLSTLTVALGRSVTNKTLDPPQMLAESRAAEDAI